MVPLRIRTRTPKFRRPERSYQLECVEIFPTHGGRDIWERAPQNPTGAIVVEGSSPLHRGGEGRALEEGQTPLPCCRRHLPP